MTDISLVKQMIVVSAIGYNPCETQFEFEPKKSHTLFAQLEPDNIFLFPRKFRQFRPGIRVLTRIVEFRQRLGLTPLKRLLHLRCCLTYD
jgi:hypothetical protein